MRMRRPAQRVAATLSAVGLAALLLSLPVDAQPPEGPAGAVPEGQQRPEPQGEAEGDRPPEAPGEATDEPLAQDPGGGDASAGGEEAEAAAGREADRGRVGPGTAAERGPSRRPLRLPGGRDGGVGPGLPRVSPPMEPEWVPFFPERAASSADQVDRLFLVELAICTLIVLMVTALLVVFCVRYRAGSSADRHGQVHEPRKVELTWIALTTLVFLGMFAYASVVFFRTQLAPDDAMRIDVVGKQWMWKIQHGNGRREINELHVPAGVPVQLVLTSQDVIHSFFVPAFRLKHDALPGRYTQLWFEADRPGVYHLFCAEYCGTEHSKMVGRVVVLEPEAFARWLDPGRERVEPDDGQPGAPVARVLRRGEGPFFRYGCDACHLIGTEVRAPRLDGLFGRFTRLSADQLVRVDEDYIRESILRPNAKIVAGYPAPSLMPSYEGVIPDEELAELVEFIRGLRDGWDVDAPSDSPFGPGGPAGGPEAPDPEEGR